MPFEPLLVDAVAHEGVSVLAKLTSAAINCLPSNQEAAGVKDTIRALELMEKVLPHLDATAREAFWHQLQSVERAKQKSSARPGLFGIRAAHQYRKMASELKEFATTSSTQVRANAFKPDDQPDTRSTKRSERRACTVSPLPTLVSALPHTDVHDHVININVDVNNNNGTHDFVDQDQKFGSYAHVPPTTDVNYKRERGVPHGSTPPPDRCHREVNDSRRHVVNGCCPMTCAGNSDSGSQSGITGDLHVKPFPSAHQASDDRSDRRPRSRTPNHRRRAARSRSEIRVQSRSSSAFIQIELEMETNEALFSYAE